MNCIEVSSPCPTIHPPPDRPGWLGPPRPRCLAPESRPLPRRAPLPHRCAVPLDLSRAILPCFFLAHFTVSDSLARTARQIERQTPTATFPSPTLSLGLDRSVRATRSIARARLLPLAPIHDDQGRAHNFSNQMGSLRQWLLLLYSSLKKELIPLKKLDSYLCESVAT